MGALVERRVVGADDEQVGVLALVELGEPAWLPRTFFRSHAVTDSIVVSARGTRDWPSSVP